MTSKSMRFSAGDRLGGYAILSVVGAGGMGEVFSARDENLGRTVAIKVLPEAFALDEARTARFEREARLLASLNHPNIATLHGLEEHDGTRFLVMELVGGETLAETIARGPMSWDEARALFVQIAEGLEAAHAKGVVHRDLKPPNIKITPDGKAKILDFGLAKALEADDDDSAGASQSPTLTKGTALGTIMGTASYMSPEQARGKSVDARTDVWAFGCVLFEALAGKKAFEGETVTDTIAAVVNLEPDWRAVPTDTPVRVRELLERCLRKDPTRRLHSVADARIEMEDADAERMMPVVAAPRRYAGIAFAAGFALAALAAGIIFSATRGAGSVAEAKRVTIQIPRTDRVFFNVRAPVISPNGKHIAYIAERDSGPRQLFLRWLDEFEPAAIDGSDDVEFSPFFSPDGQWLGYVVGNEIRKVAAAGGIPVTLAQVPGNTSGSWGRDGTILASDSKELVRFPDTGGEEPVVIFRAEDGELLYWPELLPGEKAALLTSVVNGNTSVAIVRLDTAERLILVEDGMNPHYLASGYIVFERGEQLLAAPFDAEALELLSTPVPVVDGVRDTGNAYRGQFSLSRNGTLLYVAAPVSRGRGTIVWVDRDGSVEPASELKRNFVGHSKLSPNGRQLAVSLVPESGAQTEIWVLEIGRDTLTRLTLVDSGTHNRPFWTPDGEHVLYTSNGDIVVQPADGRAGPTPIAPGHYHATSLSSDGSTVIFFAHDDSTNAEIGMTPSDGSEEPKLLLDSPSFNEHSGVLSPDDRFLAYVSDESGRDEVYVLRFPSLADRKLISTDGGYEPLWSRDGRELFYRNGERMMAVDIRASETEIDATKPEVLFEGRFQLGGNSSGANYDVAPDGRFLMIQEDELEQAETSLRLVLDWESELQRLVPYP